MSASVPDPGDLQRQLRELLDYPREDLGVEVKAWLDLDRKADRALLACELLALANYGGGYLVFGFADAAEGWSPADPCPFDLSRYSQDNINGICERYAEPHFHCAVHHLNSSAGDSHVVVEVPGGHRVPIRSKHGGPEADANNPEESKLRSNQYYVRRPGPQSAPISSAQEWDELLRRCLQAQREDLLESFRSLVFGLGSKGAKGAIDLLEDGTPTAVEDLAAWDAEGRARLEHLVDEDLPSESPGRYEAGTWSVAYRLWPAQPPAPPTLLDVLNEVAGRETGWPPWWVPTRDGIRPYPHEGLIECWLAEPGQDEQFSDGAHSDFWRADPEGRMFLVRGYQEDGGPDAAPRAGVLDFTLPVWRVGECLLHAQRLAERLGSERIAVRLQWNGLQGRELVSLNMSRDLHPGRVSHQESVVSTAELDAAHVSEGLPEIVKGLVEPLYACFDFFSPPAEFYAQELARMRGRVD